MKRSFLTILSCLLLQLLYAQSDKQFVVKGNEFYKKQEYEKAAEQYKQALSKNDKNVEARYNLGNALYKSKKAEEARKAFEGTSEIAGDRNMKARSNYNKGVVLTRDNKLQESVEAYKQSLRQNPTDEEARENLQKALNELKKQEQQKDKNKNQDQDKKQDQEDKQKNKSSLSEKQAERMLNAVRQEEKKQMEDKQKSRSRSGGMPEKDW